MFIESLVALVVLANVTVPVVPDPDYLQQLYPSVNPNSMTFGEPVTQESQGGAGGGGGAQPFDIGSIVSLAVTAGLGYMFQRNKTTMDRRTYMAADTTAKLADNDKSSDAQALNVVYALTCIADIMGKHHKEDMETYQTRDGVSLWTYIEILNKNFDQNFNSRYVSSVAVETTGTQSKDKVVATFNRVQQQITPTPLSTVPMPVGSGRVQSNKIANEGSAAVQQVKATTTQEKDTAD